MLKTFTRILVFQHDDALLGAYSTLFIHNTRERDGITCCFYLLNYM